ncbi:MAG TPA: hypothetical protein VL091_11535 [Marinobacter sp.]|nr:hypothetical protein [Marinobacter sp.]
MKVHKKVWSLNRIVAFTGLAATLVLSGCGGDSKNTSLTSPTGLANAGVVASVSSDFSSGAVNVIDLDSANYNAFGPFHETGSDIGVVGGTGHYYILGRYGMDYISKVDISNLAKKTWDEFPVNVQPEQNSGNPYDLITVNDQKAYLLRYDSEKILIVNPSATNEVDFFSGEVLDLSGYTPSANADGPPRVSAAVLVGEKLFVTLQRLNDAYAPVNTSYVAVFDVNTDKEIDTGKGTDGLKGIPLLGTNPDDIQYHEGIGLVVRNIGTNYPTYGDGTSLDIINVNDYEISPMIPATTTADEGQLLDVVIVSENLGYIINLTGYMDTKVQSFDPTIGRDSFETINNLTGGDYRDIELSPKGNLWIADADGDKPGIRIINTTDNSEIKFVDSLRGLLPNNIAFVTE